MQKILGEDIVNLETVCSPKILVKEILNEPNKLNQWNVPNSINNRLQISKPYKTTIKNWIDIEWGIFYTFLLVYKELRTKFEKRKQSV